MKSVIYFLAGLFALMFLISSIRDYSQIPIMEVDSATRECLAIRLPPKFEAMSCEGNIPKHYEVVYVGHYLNR